MVAQADVSSTETSRSDRSRDIKAMQRMRTNSQGQGKSGRPLDFVIELQRWILQFSQWRDCILISQTEN